MSRKTILSILLNVTFVLTIFAVRYYFVKQEYDFLEEIDAKEFFITSNVTKDISKKNDISVSVKKAEGTKCSRCWKIVKSVKEGKCQRCYSIK